MTQPILISDDSRTIQIINATAASAGAQLVIGDVHEVASLWDVAKIVVIDAESAEEVARAGLPAREGVYICGTRADDLLAWSVPLNASVLLLPDQTAFLSAILTAPTAHVASQGSVIEVLSGSGGAGASTLATGLAIRAATRGRQTALFETDPCGGGLDLLCGIQDSAGWRWPDLRNAAGHVSDLAAGLPTVEGVTLVSHSWQDDDRGSDIPVGALSSIASSLGYTHDLLLADSGSHPAGVQPVTSIIVVAASVASVFSAKARLTRYEPANPVLVVRSMPVGSLDARTIAETLHLPLAATLPWDRAYMHNALDGKPPGVTNRRLAKIYDQIWDAVGHG